MPILLVRAGISFAFAAIIAFAPFRTVTQAASLWAAFATVDGVLTMIAGRRGALDRRLTLTMQGLISVLAGIVALVLAFVLPSVAYVLIAVVVGGTAMISAGILALGGTAVRERTGRRLPVVSLAAVAALAAGVLILSNAGAFTRLRWVLAAYACVNAALLLQANRNIEVRN